MAATSSPTVRRRRLAAILRDLREQSGLTVAAAAAALDTSQSRLSRVERALYPPPRGPELRIMLALYGVTGKEAEKLVVISRDARQKGWWHSYRDSMTDGYATFIGLEDAAAAICAFEPMLIPGLFQTERYARAVVGAGPFEVPPDQAENLIRVRMGRQKILAREHPPRVRAVIDEAVLHRTFGGAAVMREQLLHLAECGQMPGIAIQVIPFMCGTHPSMSGAFHVISFPDTADPDVAYAGTPLGNLYAEEPDDTDRLKRAFHNLSVLALSDRASMEAVARAAASM